MLAEVIELYPKELMCMVEGTLANWREGAINRAVLNDEISLCLALFGRKQLRVEKIGLRVTSTNSGNLVYDSDNISVNSACPQCGRYFVEGATTMYIHPGLQQYDKYVYACNCGKFFAMYCAKDE